VLPERPRNFSQVGAAVNGGGGCYIRPDVLVPVHTFEGDKYQALFGGDVRRRADGEWWKV